jgi:hypothetical protein
MDRESGSYAIGRMRFEGAGWFGGRGVCSSFFGRVGSDRWGEMIGGTIFGGGEGRWGVSQLLIAAAESSVASMGRMSQAIMPMLSERIDRRTGARYL